MNWKKSILWVFLSLFLFSCGDSKKQMKETFEIGNKTFLLNGEPFIIKAAELHYPRIPEAYWEHRIKNELYLFVYILESS